MRDGFIFHLEYADIFSEFSLSEQGMFLCAMVQYEKDRVEPDFEDRAMRVVWMQIKRRMDKDIEAYEEKCKMNAENGKKGGRPKTERFSEEPKETERFFEKPKETQRNPKKPKKPDTDTDIDIDYKKKGTNVPKEKDAFAEAFADFKKMRKQIKKPLSERAEKMILKKLDTLASTPQGKIEILNQSVLHCWQDVYALKSDSGGKNKFHNFEQRKDDLTMIEAELDRQFANSS